MPKKSSENNKKIEIVMPGVQDLKINGYSNIFDSLNNSSIKASPALK